MEASLIGSSQVILGRRNDTSLSNFSRNLNLNFNICNLKNDSCNLIQRQRFSVSASSSSQLHAVVPDTTTKDKRIKPSNGTKLYVGLPVETVSSSNTINHARAIAAGLKALKLLGVNGVELPVWWGIAENEAMGKYDWTGYLAVAEMVQKLGMELHVSLCFHASREHNITLPQWVSRIGEMDPSIYFMDRSGCKYEDCLSLSVDDLPVLDGKTPLEVYRDFCESFKSAFSPCFGSTITGLSIGLGPDGELRYPSKGYRERNNCAGEFQCYDKHMLGKLLQHAELQGNRLWGFAGPHDAPSNDQNPLSGGFFSESGGSWESPYGEFFLSWYSGQLLCHGDQMLSLAASTFSDTPLTLSGKLPLMHSWYNTRSHPTELTAGFYNTDNRNGYDTVAEIFARNSCRMIIPGMELSDKDVPGEFRASPEALLAQITSSCRKHGIEVSGENLPTSCATNGFEQIKKNLLGKNAVANALTYQRMGAYFFSPEHFRAFAQFVRSLNQPNRTSDDLPVEEESAESLPGKDMQMLAA